MSFLFPAFLLAGLAAAVPILLHFFARDRAPRLPFSDVRFLERVFVRRDRRRRLRELLLLALRVVALLLLAVAFARPFLDAAGEVQRLTVVAVDRSASLSAAGQMALARETALGIVAATPPDELLAVVAFDDAAEVVARPAMGRPPARAAIERIVPTAGATGYAAALAAAVDLLDAREGRVVVVTDLQAAGWTEGESVAVPEHVAIEVAAVPPVERNLAVRAVRPAAEGLAAVILNTGSGAVETQAALSLDGREIDRRRVTLGPGANDVRWPQAADGAMTAAVSVSDPAGYRWDDTRYVLLGAASPTVVHVATNGATLDAEALYIAQALGAAPESRPFEVRPLAPAELAESDAASREQADVLVVLGTDGLSRSARARVAAFVEAGGGLLLAAGPGVDPRLVRDVLGESVELAIAAAGRVPSETPADAAVRRLAVGDPRHPVFRRFGDLVATLGQVRFNATASVDVSDPRAAAAGAASVVRVLARFDNGDPALVEYPGGAGRALVLGSDLSMDWNDFPRHPAFVPFLQETVRYLAGPGESPRDVLVADVPAGVPRVPGATIEPATGRPIAVNVDPLESEPRALLPDGFLARLGDAPGASPRASRPSSEAAREAEQSVWWYVVLAVAIVLIGEAWLGRTMA